jgi:hypothetical protein
MLDLSKLEGNENKIPMSLVFYQNYPYPFNPSTTIKFSIPPVVDAKFASTTHVQLKVYDVPGREVTNLVNEDKQPGEYEVEFYASSHPSGVYFYQLKTGNFIQAKKMLLLK